MRLETGNPHIAKHSITNLLFPMLYVLKLETLEFTIYSFTCLVARPLPYIASHHRHST